MKALNPIHDSEIRTDDTVVSILFMILFFGDIYGATAVFVHGYGSTMATTIGDQIWTSEKLMRP